ncbi:MAG TPA: fatty acid desaturase CarF family protein [Verrucomicrobiae bacterium]|jgi:ubiquitin-conjugating enzyme E2 variant|nr:fatty acid desaturase CarF family protein [Verrucomicrobiae bacterium]
MKTALLVLLKLAATVLAADFVGGLVHWFEDAYVRENTPLIGRLVARPNIVHHHYPRYMIRHSWWQTSWNLAVLSAVMVIAAWFAGLLTWEVWLFAILSANANEFHKWAHRTRKENGRLISFLQDIRLLQTARHHARHHTDPKESHYCTMTNVLNPFLDRMHFWTGMEFALARTIRLQRREDTSVRGNGPGPAWLVEYRR